MQIRHKCFVRALFLRWMLLLRLLLRIEIKVMSVGPIVFRLRQLIEKAINPFLPKMLFWHSTIAGYSF